MQIFLWINQRLRVRPIELKAEKSRKISFEIAPTVGNHQLRIENSTNKNLTVFESTTLDISKMEIHQYCSAKAKPYEIEADTKANRFKITAGGSDFYHAEDSYAATYLKGIKGDFVATVKINQFGNRTHEWFRSGLFVRNDIVQSFDVQPGSKGSVLVLVHRDARELNMTNSPMAVCTRPVAKTFRRIRKLPST